MKVKSVIFIYSLFIALCGMAGTIVLSPIGELSPVGAEILGQAPGMARPN